MATKAGVGTSHHHSPTVAGHEAAEKALRNADASEPDFVFMFATVGHDQPSLLQAVREATGGAPLTGCSGDGTISGDAANESNFSVVVMVIASDELRWHHGLATGLGADSRGVGQLVVQSLSSDLSADAVGLFVFPDGITGVNVDHFFAGLDGNLSNDQFLPIWGGCSADNLALGQTYQYCDDDVVSDGVAYALLSGAAQLASAIGISYIPIGGERTVTRSKENVIYEIDGKAALEVLQEYLPDSALADNWGRYILTYGLCFEAPSFMYDEEYVLRAVTSMNKDDGSIILSTEIPEGTSVWFSSRDKETVTAGLDRMAAQINQELEGDHPKLVLHFDCVARGKIMFRDQEKLANLRRLRQSLGPDTPWAGFYSYGDRSGEQSQLLPQLLGGGSRPGLTMKVVVLGQLLLLLGGQPLSVTSSSVHKPTQYHSATSVTEAMVGAYRVDLSRVSRVMSSSCSHPSPVKERSSSIKKSTSDPSSGGSASSLLSRGKPNISRWGLCASTRPSL